MERLEVVDYAEVNERLDKIDSSLDLLNAEYEESLKSIEKINDKIQKLIDSMYL